MGSFYKYKHIENLYCPFRNAILKFTMFILLLTLNFKMVRKFYLVSYIEYAIFYNLFCFYFLVFFILSIFSHWLAIAFYYFYFVKDKSFKKDTYKTIALKNSLVLMAQCLLLGLQCGYYYFLNDTDFGSRVYIIGYYIIIAIIMILACVLIFGLGYLLIKGIQYVYQILRNLSFYNNNRMSNNDETKI